MSSKLSTPEAVRESVIVVSLVIGAVVFAIVGHTDLASMALGGAMGRASGNAVNRPGAPAALAIVGALAASAFLSGCGAGGAATARRAFCEAQRVVCAGAELVCDGSSGGEIP